MASIVYGLLRILTNSGKVFATVVVFSLYFWPVCCIENEKVVWGDCRAARMLKDLCLSLRGCCCFKKLYSSASGKMLLDMGLTISIRDILNRNTQPRFQFIVLNRRSADNLVENLLGDFEYEVQVPYLLYRNAAQEVNGIWFYNPRECEDVANLFTRILSAYSKVPSKPKPSTKSEFEELEGVSSMSVVETLLEPSPTTPAIDSPEDSTAFMNFFNMALNIGKHADPAKSMQHNHSTATVPLSPLLPSVASSPAPNPDMLNLSLSSSYYPIPWNDSSDLTSSSDRISRLIKPSSFLSPPSSSSALLMPPISSSNPTTASLRPPLNLQHPHGTTLLNPFPPPTPSASLNPSPTPPAERPLINRERVRDALLMLVQDDQFVDLFYQTLLKVQFK